MRVFQTRGGTRGSLSPPNYFDLREDQGVFSGLAAYWSPSVTLTGEGDPERLLAATVSYNLFDVLGVPPVLGRAFTAEDDEPGAPLVAIVGHGLFARRFGSDHANPRPGRSPRRGEGDDRRRRVSLNSTSRRREPSSGCLFDFAATGRIKAALRIGASGF